MTFRINRRTLVTSMAAAIAMPHVRIAGAQEAPRRGGTLTGTIGFPEPHAMFVPGGGGGSPRFTATKMLEPLVRMRPDITFDPCLALSWSASPDFTSYTLQLRPNVKWHDGTPFTSEDVAFSIGEYWKSVSPVGILSVLKSAEAKGPLTVVLTFDAPVPEFSLLTVLNGDVMIPKHIYSKGPDLRRHPANNAPIGTGPWKFKEWARGRYAELERFNDYWDQGKPYPERLVIRWWREPSARAAALESGALDIGVQNPIPLADIKRLQANPNFVVTASGYGGAPWQAGLIFNTRNDVVKNVAVRQAILHAIDRQFIANTIYYGFAKPAVGALSTANPIYFNPDVPKFEFNPAKAAKLLDEAGARVGSDGTRFTVKLVAAGWVDENGKIGRYLLQALGDIGIRVNLEIPDRIISLRKIYTDYDFDLAISNQSLPPDPAPITTQIYTKAGIAKGMFFRNASGFHSPEIEDLVSKLLVATDPAQRKELVHRFAVAATRSASYVPLVEVQKTTAARARVKNHSREADEAGVSWSGLWLAS